MGLGKQPHLSVSVCNFCDQKPWVRYDQKLRPFSIEIFQE